MLRTLTIDGMAVIEHLKIDFSDGLNVITGETGAGKSILIKALNFLMGGKATPDVVRSGWSSASVCGEYQLPRAHPTFSKISSLGISFDADESSLILRRSITDKGRSQAWINDIPVTLATLKAVCMSLVDILGQHEHQSLGDPARHLDAVDMFIEDREVLTRVTRNFKKAEEITLDLRDLADRFSVRKRDLDYLEYRLAELEEFRPECHEYEALQVGVKEGEANVQRQTALASAQQILDQGFDGEPISGAFWSALARLEGFSDVSPDILEIATELRETARRADDLSYSIGKFLSRSDESGESLEANQDRLAGYQDLMRKFGCDEVLGLKNEEERLRQEVAFIAGAAIDAMEKIETLKDIAAEFKVAVEALSISRKNAAKRIEKSVASQFKDLGMAGAKFTIELERSIREFTPLSLEALGKDCDESWKEVAEMLTVGNASGGDRIHFLLRSNAGEEPKPLHKIASGGELSRIMLAFKAALASGGNTCVLVFDEVDTGISGRVADLVGAKLKEMAAKFQTICISHLPQVAAYHDAHFVVAKSTAAGRTETSVRRLTDTESTEEIARLLSADKVTGPSIQNALQLRKNASLAVSQPSGRE